jgi:uncharacterized protein YdaU (DUF1376 family)
MSKAWMPIYWGDYLRDTQHLTTLQHGAYLLLIAHYWQHGSLPNSDRALAVICKFSKGQWQTQREAIAKLFLPAWRHKRIDAELARAQDISNKRAVFGAIGGRRNRGKTNQYRSLDKANAEAIAKQRDAPQSPSPKKVGNGIAVDGCGQAYECDDNNFGKPHQTTKPSTGSAELKAALRAKGWI